MRKELPLTDAVAEGWDWGGDAELQQVHGVCGRCVPRSHSWMEAFPQQLCPSCLDLLEHKEGDIHSLLLAAAWAGAAETKRS